MPVGEKNNSIGIISCTEKKSNSNLPQKGRGIITVKCNVLYIYIWHSSITSICQKQGSGRRW